MAEAARLWAKKARLGLFAQNEAAEIKLEAECMAGLALAVMDKQGPGQYQRLHDETVAPSLAERGINKVQSHRWQKVARVPEALFGQGAGQKL